MATKYQDEELKRHALPNFSDGYNSYPASRALVKDTEIPAGQNVVLDDNGSATKVPGITRFGVEIASGKAIRGLGNLYNTTHNKLIVAAGTAWYLLTTSTKTALTGVTFTNDKKTQFCQAVDRLYGANNTDNLAWTDDGAAITSVSSNGNIGAWPIVYGQRLYMTNATYPDRIYFSNPTTYTTTGSSGNYSYAIGDFGTFNIDLTATPKKNAGFIILLPGSGVVITRLFKDSQAGSDYVYAYTKKHGIWRIALIGTANADGSIAHTVTQVVTTDGTPAGDSVLKVGNDQWYRSKWNYSSLGEAAQYQNIRVSTKGGRVKSEAEAVTGSALEDTAGGFYKEKVYFSYRLGTYTDRLFQHDTRLNAWSTPIIGINAAQFLEWEDSDGVIRFLAGSSNSADSYVYQLDSGTNFQGTAIDANFSTKSTDCGYPGLIKRFAFAKVYYSQIVGTLNYQVFIDNDEALTSELQTGTSAGAPPGVGSQMIGNFMVGAEYDSTASSTSISTNSDFTIDLGYEAGKKIYITFSNNVLSENFKIDGVEFFFLLGDVYETES